MADQHRSKHDKRRKHHHKSSKRGESREKAKVKVWEPAELWDSLRLSVEGLQDVAQSPEFYTRTLESEITSLREKTLDGVYKDPWEYLDDVSCMFNKINLIPGKSSRENREYKKLPKLFYNTMDPIMCSLGYCCSRTYHYHQPPVLKCNGVIGCTILGDATYYRDPKTKCRFCEQCFDGHPSDVFELFDNTSKETNHLILQKTDFVKTKNPECIPEQFVKCKICKRKFHLVCVRHIDCIWPNGFTCDNCHKANGTKRKENKYTAKRLPTTRLSKSIENRINSYLGNNNSGNEKVTIRVVCNVDKIVEVKGQMKLQFADTGKMPESFPYRSKAILAFQEIDGVDVCFFGMYLQEYGSECPAPNTRRVYISYLDSVHFFKPKHLRTAVYHEIVIGYLKCAKERGYMYVHLWANPPKSDDPYIFYCHPKGQHIPSTSTIQSWYKKLLGQAMSENVVIDVKDILCAAKANRWSSPAELPYFDGEFWTYEIESELEKEMRTHAGDEVAMDVCLPADEEEYNGQSVMETEDTIVPYELPSFIINIFEKVKGGKKGFFVIQLNRAEDCTDPCYDPDDIIDNQLMGRREDFLDFARSNQYEFCTLRHCQYSSMALLFELHMYTDGKGAYFYNCDNCKQRMDRGYCCSRCEREYCVDCYEKRGHRHSMKLQKFS